MVRDALHHASPPQRFHIATSNCTCRPAAQTTLAANIRHLSALPPRSAARPRARQCHNQPQAFALHQGCRSAQRPRTTTLTTKPSRFYETPLAPIRTSGHRLAGPVFCGRHLAAELAAAQQRRAQQCWRGPDRSPAKRSQPRRRGHQQLQPGGQKSLARRGQHQHQHRSAPPARQRSLVPVLLW